jgi:uncharacterized protein (DUF1499 family)
MARRFSPVVFIAAALALSCLLLLLLSGPGYRLGLFGLHTAINFVKWSGELAIIAGITSLVAAVVSQCSSSRRGFSLSIGTFILSLLLLGNALRLKDQAQRVPPIHDITTDTDDPPVFREIVSRRNESDNPLDYGGAELAQAQHGAYPDINPLDLSMPPKDAFLKAEAVAKALGWQVVESDPETGSLEATDTTFWLGFKDDIVVRVRPRAEGSRIDVRSASRVGMSDLGKNAARIRRFLSRLKDRQ